MQLMGPVGLFLGPSIVSMAIGMIRDFLERANPV
jgi:predicted PurR-regulated permease PerM